MRIVLLVLLSLYVGAPPAQADEGRMTRDEAEAILNSSRDFSWRDLRGLDLSGLSLAGVNFIRSNLAGADLRRAELSRARLRGANLTDALLENAVLIKADLAEANLTGTNLAGAQLIDANLAAVRSSGGTILRGANLTATNLVGASLRGADLSGGTLHAATMVRADLRSAQLTGAILTEAALTMASFVGADLTRADFRRARLNRADFEGSNLHETYFAGADAKGALNVEKAKNTKTTNWTATAPLVPAPTGAQASAGRIAARIHPKNGDPIDAESWSEEGEVFLFTRLGVSYGIAKENVRRIEDPQGRTLRVFVDRSSASESEIRLKNCKPPRVGDAVSYVTNYLECVRKYGLRAIASQGVSARAAGEWAGAPLTGGVHGMLVRRWELRDEAGRLIEVYEAVGDKITLVTDR
jgi:uncharacterized protein YjbI with pentapeptide repeats